MNFFKDHWVGLVAMIIALGSFISGGSQLFGAASPTGPQHRQQEAFIQGLTAGSRNQSYFDNVGKLTIGTSGTAITTSLFGNCNMSQEVSGSFAASTSAQFFCNVTGVNAGDNIVVDLPLGAGPNPLGAGSIGQGFVVVGAYATTSNVIGITVDNFTGAATTSFPQATTTVQYRVLR